MKALVSLLVSVIQFFCRSKRDCVRFSWAVPGQDYTSSQTLRISRITYNKLQKNPWGILDLKSDLKKALADGRPMPPYIEAWIAQVKGGQILETKTIIRTHAQVSQDATKKTTSKKGAKK